MKIHDDRELMRVTYGSRLYGTDTPQSDTDVKAVYLPNIDGVLLLRKPKIRKTRLDAAGLPVPDGEKMPDGGVETEHIPLQVFAADFVRGQTYAVEIAMAVLHGEGQANPMMRKFVMELTEHFANADVYSMVGFAQKQTLDYVTRGERLKDAQRVQAAVQSVIGMHGQAGEGAPKLRLDTPFGDAAARGYPYTVLDHIASVTGLEIGSAPSGNRPMRTLELNGRSYLETSALEHLATAIDKLVNGYGERTVEASKADVDLKSLSHAVRVYEQAIELLETGTITFPRPNAAELLAIKLGQVDLDAVKARIIDLDATVQQAIADSQVRKRTPELEAEAERWLVEWLEAFYGEMT